MIRRKKAVTGWMFLCTFGFILILNATGSNTLLGQAAKALGKNWPRNQVVKVTEIDHQSWDTLVKKYVNKDGKVNYQAWKNSAADRKSLSNYLNGLSKKQPETFSTVKGETRTAELAFWINAYNALTVDGILRLYPTTSIRNHTAKVWGYNIWTQHKLKVGGTAYSLEDIEHKILRKMREPRIHFAIVCASIGCPRLLNEAYTKTNLNQQLETNAKDFFSRKQNYRLDRSRNRVYLSSILKWFATDFGTNQKAQLKRISKYVPDSDQGLLKGGKLSVSYLDYDWKINKQ